MIFIVALTKHLGSRHRNLLEKYNAQCAKVEEMKAAAEAEKKMLLFLELGRFLVRYTLSQAWLCFS